MQWRNFRLLSVALISISRVEGWSFTFDSKPTQCNNLTVHVDGGTPPYRIVMVPSGPLNGPEIRTIVDHTFSDTSFTLPPLAFPGGSNFTAVVNDATGVGAGGTSVITDVGDSNDNSCLSTTSTNPLFYLELPQNPALTQCGSMQISFSDTAQGDVTLMGLIPGGESFSVPVDSGSRSVNWNPICIPAGTGVMLVAGDSRGAGTGGSAYMMIVQNGNDDCLHSGAQVYSSTNSPYAGGQYATGSGGGTVTGPWGNGPSGTTGSNNGGGGKKTNVSLIVGLVCGLVALFLIIFILLLLWRRRRARRSNAYGGTKEVDLLKDRPVPVTHAAAATGGEQRLEPTPYYAASGTESNDTPPSGGHRPRESTSTAGGGSITPLVPPSSWGQHQRQYSGSGRPTTPSTDYNTSGDSHAPQSPIHSVPPTPGGGNNVPAGAFLAGTNARGDTKHAAGPSPLRPVNVVQHHDGGTIPQPPAETSPGPTDEVVELPPSYQDVRRAEGGVSPPAPQ